MTPDEGSRVRLGIIVGSVREGRRASEVAEWVLDQVRERVDLEVFVLDLRALDLPLMTAPTHPMRAGRTYADGRVRDWSQQVDACEAFVFLTPEYNHGVPGAFKNAVDHLGPEWQGKTVAFVSWGSEGGVRAVEQWRTIVSNFRMVDVRQQVSLSTRHEVRDGRLEPSDQRPGHLHTMLDELADLSRRLRT